MDLRAKQLVWAEAKDRFLVRERGVSFVRIAEAILASEWDVRRNPSSRHPSQRVFVIWMDGYPWVVPFEETADTIFLRTAFPDRRFRR